MFFSCEVSYAVRELEQREILRNFLKIGSVPSEKEIYRILSKYDSDEFSAFVSDLLNELCLKEKVGPKALLLIVLT